MCADASPRGAWQASSSAHAVRLRSASIQPIAADGVVALTEIGQADDGCALATAGDITAATLEPLTAKGARTLVRLLESLR